MISTRREGSKGEERRGREAEGVIDRILSRLSDDVGPERYARFFQHQARVGLDGGRIDVTVPTGFVADLIGRRFGASLRRAASSRRSG